VTNDRNLPSDPAWDELGVQSSSSTKMVLDDDASSSSVELGDAAAVPVDVDGPALDAWLLRAANDQPEFEPLDVGAAPVRVERWQHGTQVVSAELTEPGSIRITGAVTDDRGRLLFAGTAPGRAVFVTARGRYALLVEGKRLRFWRVFGDDELEPRDGEPIPDRAAVVADAMPSPESLLGLVEGEDWLVARVSALSVSPSVLDRATALGLLARLHRPVVAPREAVLAALADPAATTAGRVVAWACAATPTLLDYVAFLAGSVLDVLLEDLDADIADLEDDQPEVAATRVGLARDDLESVCVLLEASGRGDGLRAGLDGYDHQIALHGAFAFSLQPVDDPQLRAVGWQEPSAWWGRLAVSAR
jgi:hypothetical protein